MAMWYILALGSSKVANECELRLPLSGPSISGPLSPTESYVLGDLGAAQQEEVQSGEVEFSQWNIGLEL